MFWKRITLFKILGFAIRLDASWILIAFLITWSLATGFYPFDYEGLSQETYWLMGALSALGLFISIIIHEFSHSIVARQYGIPISGITLFIFGGVAEMTKEPDRPKAEFLMAIAGPIASLLLAGFFWVSFKASSAIGLPVPVQAVLNYLALINAILALFNMVPAFPLDGGRVFRAVLWHLKGDIKEATRIASKFGTGFGLLLMVLGGAAFITGNIVAGIWWFFIGIFLRNASMSSYQQILVKNALEGEQASRFMKTNPITVKQDLSLQKLVDDYFYRHHHKMFPVTTDGALVGLATLAGVKKIDASKRATTTVRDILEPCSPENTIIETEDAMNALSKMSGTNRSRLLVVDRNEQLVGILTLKDMLEFFAVKFDLEKNSS